MKNLILVLIGLFLMTSNVEASSDVKIVNFNNFFSKMEINPNLDLMNEDRLLYDYLIVQIPAKTLSLRGVYRISSEPVKSFLLLTNEKVLFSMPGDKRKFTGNLRLLYFCEESNEMCQENLDDLLTRDIEVRSLGVSNSDRYTKLGEASIEFTFSFLLNEKGSSN